MMAKQSALNTKNVQKLKEKAKSATEKRLKFARKAQMKAIKQVEKDERYLVKLSANRRLLKSAHSISDIKLVGRNEAINFSPGSDSSSFMSRESNSSSLASRSSQSSSISNLLINQRRRTNLDLFGARQWRKQQTKDGKLHSSASSSSSDKDESAYSSSSMSTTSGYTSSNSNRNLFGVSSVTANKQKQSSEHGAHFRPKFSELVALSANQTGQSSVALNEKKQSSLKSNSTISARALKGISGISRKMHLKRLTQLADLQRSSSNLNKCETPVSKVSLDDLSLASWRVKSGTNDEVQRGSSGRLCNVQPAIRLKLNAQETKTKSPTEDDLGAFADDGSTFRWPPVPNLSRTISEPDFGLTMRGTGEIDLEQSEPELLQKRCRPGKYESDSTYQLAPSRAGKQQQLLTDCLSQLKLQQHQSVDVSQQSSGEAVDANNNGPVNIKPVCLHKHKTQAANVSSRLISHSDELLQHQMNAGKAPLKPSLIKQHQQHLSRQLPACTKQADPSTGDSIGSAGSLAQRSSQTSSGSTSGKLTGDYLSMVSPPSSPGYASSVSSSFEPLSSAQETKPKSVISAPGAAVLHPPRGGAKKSSNLDTPAKVVEGKKIRCAQMLDIEGFLCTNGLSDLLDVFAKEKIDLEALVLLNEDDLKSLNILLGPRRKLLKAIETRRNQIKSDAHLGLFVSMVDTAL